mmetsp:Transcript_62115/g.147176  ORF Transcript_62115/g.147176 Transcript_62115/m.147176 type:complete len:190 (-) Transcript_62115:1548-2117(-)
MAKNRASAEETLCAASEPVSLSSTKVTVARWRSTEGVFVATPKGKMLHHLYREGENLIISVLEAVYLLECGAAILLNGERSISISEAHGLLHQAGLDNEMFLVYSHFRKLGFQVRKSPCSGGARVMEVQRAGVQGRCPDFLVSIVRPTDDANQSIQAMQDKVHSFCVVDGGALTFFSVSKDVDLVPDLP